MTKDSGRVDRLSQAEPQEGLGPPGFDPARGWIISMGDWPHFSIEKADADSGDVYSNEGLNGLYPTQLDAVQYLIACFEESREALAAQIARAKTMRRRLLRDSDSRPEGENSRSEVEGEARQSAAAQTADRPTPPQKDHT